MSAEIHEIAVDRIKPGKIQLRPLDEGKVAELARSIEQEGQLLPVLVRPVGAGFELIFGHHRLAACKKAGLKTIKCNVCDATDGEAFLMAEAENLNRNDFVDPIAEAKGFKMLVEQGMSEKEVAKRIGKTQQYVSGRLQLLRLEPEIQESITSRLVPAELGLELSKISEPKKRAILAELCVGTRKDALTLRQLRKMAKIPIRDLAKDPRVDEILLRDPAERLRRMEERMSNLEASHSYVMRTVPGLLDSWTNRAYEGFVCRVQGDVLLQFVEYEQHGRDSGSILLRTGPVRGLATRLVSEPYRIGNHEIIVPMDGQVSRTDGNYLTITGPMLVMLHPKEPARNILIPDGKAALLALQRDPTPNYRRKT